MSLRPGKNYVDANHKDVSCFVLTEDMFSYIEASPSYGPLSSSEVGVPKSTFKSVAECLRNGVTLYYESNGEYFKLEPSCLYGPVEYDAATDCIGLFIPDLGSWFEIYVADSVEDAMEWNGDNYYIMTPNKFLEFGIELTGCTSAYSFLSFTIHLARPIFRSYEYTVDPRKFPVTAFTYYIGFVKTSDALCVGLAAFGNIATVLNCRTHTIETIPLTAEFSDEILSKYAVAVPATASLASARSSKPNDYIYPGERSKMRRRGEWTPELEAKFQKQQAERRGKKVESTPTTPSPDQPSVDPMPMPTFGPEITPEGTEPAYSDDYGPAETIRM